MTPESFDAIIIGAGQAGPPLAERCSKAGLKTALIERGAFGGTCVNVGCTPTKTMVASARAIHLARRGAEFGFSAGPIQVDMARIKARKDQIVQQSSQGVEKWVRGLDTTEVIVGEALFTAPHTLRVGERVLSAPRIFLNVGARSVRPKIPGIDDVATLDNVSIMSLATVPQHLMIIGGSYIGLEFAQMYRRFSSRVTVVESGPRLIGREDADVSEAIRAVLAGEGIEFRLDATCIGLERHGQGVAVNASCKAGEPRIEGSHILMATGRVPNTHDLGLAAAGVQLDAKGYVVVGDDLQTNVAGVYALGDCNGRGAFTHTSWNDYEIVANNLFDGMARKVSDRIPTYALFVDPPLGRVGLTHDQVRASGRPALTSKLMMTKVGRAREMGETAGFMKIAVDAQTQHILGAAIFGVRGDEVIQAVLEVMAARQPYTVIIRGMHIHPTVTELLPTLLEGLAPMD